VTGPDNHAQLGEWFEELWDETEDFDEALMNEMQRSWAAARSSPHDVYMKALYALVGNRLEGERRTDVLAADEITDQLADFERVAFRQTVNIIKEHGGAFVADVVGLGKSYIGAAIVKYFEQTERARPLIVCPKALVEMWENYNERYELNARVLSQSELLENRNGTRNLLVDDPRYRDRDFVLVDESHNFRNDDIQRYRLLDEFLSAGGQEDMSAHRYAAQQERVRRLQPAKTVPASGSCNAARGSPRPARVLPDDRTGRACPPRPAPERAHAPHAQPRLALVRPRC